MKEIIYFIYPIERKLPIIPIYHLYHLYHPIPQEAMMVYK
jgi:hypothetical protein